MLKSVSTMNWWWYNDSVYDRRFEIVDVVKVRAVVVLCPWTQSPTCASRIMETSSNDSSLYEAR